MRLLLFFVSFTFSFIFYIFYNLNKSKNIFWDKILSNFDSNWLFWNFLYESFIFFIISIIFLFYFSPRSWEKSIFLDKYKILFLIFYTLIAFLFYFTNIFYNKFIIITLVLFFIWDILFKFISNINRSYFKNNKYKIRFLWIILNYISIIFSFYYLFYKDFYVYLFLISIYSIVFNYQVHKQYTNYISLTISFLLSMFLFYIFILEIYDFYIVLF